MLRNPIDISARVSPELSSFIENLIEQMDSDELLTLGTIRNFITDDLPPEIGESEHMHHFDNAESLVDELDELIEGFGESAPASDFIHAYASEALSRAIEAAADDENRENPLTLSEVRDALANGLGGSLVGNGILEDDEAEVLAPELEAMIAHYGPDAVAEDFLRYE